MPITILEREEINKAALFLTQRGYKKTEDLYYINYKLNNVSINIIYPPNSEESEVNILFIDKNKFFSIGWIALVRENIEGNTDKLLNVKKLLSYIENKYFQILNNEFCKESNALIDQYIEKHQNKFENSLEKFLNF